MIKNIIFEIGGILFDDKEKNVIVANSIGIKSVVFKNCDDIKKNITYLD